MGGLLREGGEGQRVRWPPSQIIGRGGGGAGPPLPTAMVGFL